MLYIVITAGIAATILAAICLNHVTDCMLAEDIGGKFEE